MSQGGQAGDMLTTPDLRVRNLAPQCANARKTTMSILARRGGTCIAFVVGEDRGRANKPGQTSIS
jgi:hypothetical protein